jgi:excisionase family DNA binding protein
MAPARYLTPAEAGRMLGLRPSTVRFYVDTGRLRALRTPTGIRLIPAAAVRRFAKERQQHAALLRAETLQRG